MNLVLDSSVVVKWFFKETETEKALILLHRHQFKKIQVVVPRLLLFELGNVFVNKGVRDQAEFNRNLNDFFNIGADLIETNQQFLEATFALAKKYNITFYDAAYVATAQQLKCDFVTADKKLYQKIKGLKFVKLLGQVQAF